ncbi:AMP nucleosidase [Pseudobythopirellula maris]|uniref:AMP nucleosidase n=1 Tax=Pseudobythopirellula maris TaxID=2527991 RepID=A0A5C5ZRH3_9BACT|nr:AMP nucleosidase [Pseudobythopirellula maris]TWT90152.1 AMP nucleosidase [Pseudobythopirellula maris]
MTYSSQVTKVQIAEDWLPRYTGMPLDAFGDYVLLTNFRDYVDRFARQFDCEVFGKNRPMQAASNDHGLTIINFGIGSPNAATIMDLLTARMPKATLFLGKCGGLKHSTEIGHFILPIGAIRGEGTSDDYLPPPVPALPSFKLHKFVSEKLVEQGFDYRTGVIYTTNRRVWEHDAAFREQLRSYTPIAIDMETATLFIVGHTNQIARGALLLVTDVPTSPDGIKTSESDAAVTRDWSQVHLDLGIRSLADIEEKGEEIKHFHY